MICDDEIELGVYAKKFGLKNDKACIIYKDRPSIDVNKPKLIMHGSEKNPASILKYGLLPYRTMYQGYKSEPQICLGLNNTNGSCNIADNGSKKNSAVKYAGYFNDRGVAYVLGNDIKKLRSYQETWEDFNDYERGYATVNEAIVRSKIIGLISTNIPLCAAAMFAVKYFLPVFSPEGREYAITVIR